MKNVRHFLCGLLLGAAGVYWYAFYSEDFFDAVLTWLQREADTYRASHPSTEVDAGWRPQKKGQ
ncbi:MAG: hypothetical protein AB1671_03530 [Thermodesulfobacteriota bacterium]|jgi:hypothetical protein